MYFDHLTVTVRAAVGAYAIAAALLTMLPGPNTAIVIATAVHAGRGAAARAALGISTALLFWGLAAGVGIAAILRASSGVYAAFRIVCVGYLAWLAISSLRSALRRRTPAQLAGEEEPDRRRFRMPWGFRQALLTAAFNPKLGVFFVVFLPQFIPVGTSTVGMTLLFSTIQAAEALLWFLVIGGLAALAKRWLSRSSVRRVIDGATATIFIFFTVRLALES